MAQRGLKPEDLSQAVLAHDADVDDDHDLAASCWAIPLLGCWPTCQPPGEPADDPGAAAVLDLAVGAHIRLESAVAATGGHQ